MNTEPEYYGTLTKLALISERARREPKCRFTSLAHLLDAQFLEEKLGRNDLCPCGSRKRFKKCCLKSDRS